MLVAVVAIPTLIRGLGTDRFGVLTLVWVVVGYFSLFDLGIGRALTKFVSDALGRQAHQEIAPLAWTGLALMAGLGLVGAVVAACLSRWLVYAVLKIPEALQVDTLRAFYVLALSVPFVISTAGLRGLLESYHRFDLTNVVRIPMGLFMFLGPLAVLPFSHHLFAVVCVLVVGRMLAWVAHVLLCLRAVPEMRHLTLLSARMAKPLLSFGGWMTVSSIVGPLMLYSDRFFIAGILGTTAVAFYSTPFDVISRLLIVPAALVGVLFPTFSLSFAARSALAHRVYHRAMKYLAALMLPAVILVAVGAHAALALWLGSDFATRSALVARVLMLAVFVNGLGLISQSVVQASGRPDLTAKLHLIELPLYVTYLWWLLHHFGIAGAALAWLLRVSISAAILAVMAHRALRMDRLAEVASVGPLAGWQQAGTDD
jgi:O-antigen/teichoic acid export membrane protein